MFGLVITISIVFLMKALFNNTLMSIGNMFKFERLFKIYYNEFRERDCPMLLEALYAKLLNFHNHGTEMEYQKERIKQLLNLVDTKINLKLKLTKI